MSETDTELEQRIEMQERLEDFIFGRLNQEEIDALWIEFLQDPTWLDYLLIELHIRSLSQFRQSS